MPDGTDLIYIGADSETPAMGPGKVAVDMVCMSLWFGEDGTVIGDDADRKEMYDTCKMLLQPGYILIFHYAPFDIVRMMMTFPDLIPEIFAKLDRNEIRDTALREKLLNLTDHGNLQNRPIMGGGWKRISLKLDDLVKHHFNQDISEAKHGEDSWRLRYEELSGTPASEYPEAAYDYALSDAMWAYHLYFLQEDLADDLRSDGIEPFTVESHHIRVGVSLELATCYGNKVDPDKIDEVRKNLEIELSPKHTKLLRGSFALRLSHMLEGKLLYPDVVKLQNIAENLSAGDDILATVTEALENNGSDAEFSQSEIGDIASFVSEAEGLYDGGILRAAIPPQPYKNGARDHQADCRGHREHPEYTKKTVKDCDCPVKTTAGKAEARNTAVLHQYVIDMCARSPADLRWTDASEKYPEGQVKVNSEWLKEFGGLDPVMSQYMHRQALQKIVTDYLVKLVDEDGVAVDRIHASFDSLKATGRTSSYGSKIYPSWNGQNVDPRIRGVIVPGDPENFALFSCDIRAMELCTFAQYCKNTFGQSVLGDIINDDLDAHAFLGARLAYEMDSDFHDYADDFCVGGANSMEGLYIAFMSLKTSDDEEHRAFFKKFRTFAKPTNLGYPGGLGPNTMVGYAKATFGLDLTLEQSKMFQAFWKETFPEAKYHLDYINRSCKDKRNSGHLVTDKEGNEKPVSLYKYTTPLGMLRSGASYCAAANGIGLQSFSAEGATDGFYRVQRDCFDPSRNSTMYCNVFPSLFIHDEVFGEINLHENLQENVKEIERLFTGGLQDLCPDIRIDAETALMRRWDKRADPVHDEDGNLTIWEPKK